MKELASELREGEIATLLSTALVLVVGLAAYYLLSRALKQMTRRHNVTATMEGRMRLFLRWTTFIIVGLVVLQESGLTTHAWAFLSGFFAIAAVSFVAMWSVLSNGVCAVIILVYRPFEVGDEIEVLDASDKPGFTGRVTDINLMFTRLRSETDGRQSYLQVPNNMIMQRIVRTSKTPR